MMMKNLQKELSQANIAVVGLGYVGMPLALALSKYVRVVGFDVDKKRITDLQKGWDSNREVRQSELRSSTCQFTQDTQDIKDANVYIVTVPTPIDNEKNPDLSVVLSASQTIGEMLTPGDIVVYESTVYPGATEDVCAPALEKASDLKSGQDFFLGYSPERINPGDQVHTVEKITKVVAGQTPEVAEFLAALYGKINNDNIFIAKDIKTAEASKAIENAQRDINVAFVNEITMILNKVGLSSYDVLEAARTKWNFLPFTPGLVGGHCIGVDPYYLAKCAKDIGHDPAVILAGRDINDSMGSYVASRMNEFLATDAPSAKNPADILILGFTFKSNINDIRNTKVIDIINDLKEMGHNVDVHDPHAIAEEVQKEYGIELLPSLPQDKTYDCVTLAVDHTAYTDLNQKTITDMLKSNNELKPIIYDIKGLWRELEFSPQVNYQCL